MAYWAPFQQMCASESKYSQPQLSKHNSEKRGIAMSVVLSVHMTNAAWRFLIIVRVVTSTPKSWTTTVAFSTRSVNSESWGLSTIIVHVWWGQIHRPTSTSCSVSVTDKWDSQFCFEIFQIWFFCLSWLSVECGWQSCAFRGNVNDVTYTKLRPCEEECPRSGTGIKPYN